MEEDLECNTVIRLGLGGDYFTTEWKRKTNNKPPVQLSLLFPSWNIKGEHEEPMRSRIMQEEIRNEGFKEEFSVDEGGGKRKKLRLTTDQSTVLEESFRVHNTLNQNKKLELAERLNLRPRQVEVWFQNRRARTKLKKTEVDCEYLKKCCNRLSNENRRLKKELQDLKALAKSGSSSNAPLSNIQLSMANTTRRMCPSCESITTGDNENS